MEENNKIDTLDEILAEFDSLAGDSSTNNLINQSESKCMQEMDFTTKLYHSIEDDFEVICDTSELSYMPEILAKTVITIKNRYKNIKISSIINMLLAKTAQMFTSKRIRYFENALGYPNYFAILLMPSGSNKDRLCNDLDGFFFEDFKIWFGCEVEVFKQNFNLEIHKEAMERFPDEKGENKREKYIKECKRNFRNIVIEVSDGTREGLYSDAKAYKQADFGSLFIKIPELGSYLNNATTE